MSPHYQHRTIPTGTANPDTTGETMTSTSTDVTPFDFDGHQVRTILDEHGEPWFVAADVARILGYRDAADLARLLEDEDRGTHRVRTPSGEQAMTCLTEAGLYAAIVQRRIPRAEDEPFTPSGRARTPAELGMIRRVRAFRIWVTREVLPAIRRTGSYAVPVAPLVLPTARELAALVIAEADRADAAEVERDAARAQVEAEAPAVAAHAAFLAADGPAQLVGTVAKEHGWPERRMREFLLDEGLIFTRVLDCGARQWEHYAKNAAHFDMKQVTVSHRRGPCTHSTLRVTPGGRTLVAARIARREAEVARLLAAPAPKRLTVVGGEA